MSPLFIVGIAPLGIAALIGLVALFGGNRRITFTSAEQALTRFRRDFPAWQNDDVVLSDDKYIALLPATDGQKIGLVLAVGDTFITRLLARDDFELRDDATDTARLHFHDFTAPDIDVPRSLLAQADARLAA